MPPPRRRLLAISTFLLLAPLPACESGTAPATAPALRPTLATPAATVAAVRPPLPPHAEPDMFDHASVLGWSADSRELAICVDSGCADARRCEFHLPGRAEPERVSWNAERGDPAFAQQKAALEKRIADRRYAITPVRWSHPDLALTWRLDPPAPAAPARDAKLVAGIAPRTADPATAPLDAALGPGPGMHPELLALSPDGKHLAVVGHSLVMECGDQFHVALLPTPD